jgi:hypothetical protein
MTQQKLTVVAYSDENFTSKVSGANTYSVQINPESYTHNHSTRYNPGKTSDTAGNTIKYDGIQPERLSFSFYLDGTGVVSTLDVSAQIKAFKQVAYKYNGTIHSPNYLQVIWGTFAFRGKLTQLDIEYTLFDTNGMPLRAKLAASFEEYLSPDDIAKRSAKNSPDMTHVRQAIVGDTLPLMCQRIYGDSRYYLMVANHNGLTRLRELEPGQSIVFPPLQLL